MNPGPRLLVTPVTLPPGRARLATSPISTGDALPAITMGIVVVAALAACAASVVIVTITSMTSSARPPSPPPILRQSNGCGATSVN